MSNCVVRSNYSASPKFMYSYDAGGIMRYIDTEISDNVVRGYTFIRNANNRTNVFERCAILRNSADPDYTGSAGSIGFINAPVMQSVSNCLIADNAFNARYVIASPTTIVGSTIVSNSCAAGYGALLPHAGSEVVDTVVLGTTSVADRKTALTDVYCNNKPAVTNCYFERANNVASAVGTGIVTGKTMSDLKLNWELSTEGSKTKFLDGTKMPAMTFASDSMLKDGGVAHSMLAGVDLQRKTRDAKPDIGAYEYVAPSKPKGLTLFFR